MLDTSSRGLRYTLTAIREQTFPLDMALRVSMTLAVPTITLFTAEWIHRGTLTGFSEILLGRFPSFLVAWLFLLCIFTAVSRLSGWYPLATLVTGVVGNLPAAVTFFKLQMRNEPFLPWDISQFMEASGVLAQANLKMQASMGWTIAIFALLFAAGFLVTSPKRREGRAFILRMLTGAGAAVGLGVVIFGIYLQPAATAKLGVVPDMWMQHRFYRNYGVVTGFMTNLQQLDIAKPEGYGAETVNELMGQVEQQKPDAPLFAGSFAATGKTVAEKQPNIIYIMNEAFFDVEELPGIVFDQPVTPHLQRMKEVAATGKAYSPSFGGGTCDVEFEALTGYSMEHLPAGSKPYQQHVTQEMASLPNALKAQGYETMAVHGYYRKYWNRDKAYPNLGIDTFIAAEDFVNPEKKRSHEWKGGLISDNEMANMMIEQYENRDKDKPFFMHAVTMQNHSSYNAANYPDDERVKVLDAPEELSEATRSQLEDFATGIRENDAMLGRLVEYFSAKEEPVILVFWGDHYNTVGKGYELYEKTGYIEKGDTKSPNLHGTPLVIWSNFHQEPVELGTVAAYQITPVMLDLYGLEKTPMFDFLTQELGVFRARTRGVTIHPDGSATMEMTAEQEKWFNDHWLLQYDLMFGEGYAQPPAQTKI